MVVRMRTCLYDYIWVGNPGSKDFKVRTLHLDLDECNGVIHKKIKLGAYLDIPPNIPL